MTKPLYKGADLLQSPNLLALSRQTIMYIRIDLDFALKIGGG
jgi:hypothetical protein